MQIKPLHENAKTNFIMRAFFAISPYCLVTSILLALFYLTNWRGNWSFWADQELTIGYNGLLINSGLAQEYLDHPGFFSIQISALVLKISNALGLIKFQNISEFNNQPIIFNAMSQVVAVTRHLSLLFGVAISTMLFFVSKKITNSAIISLLVVGLAFFSNGIFYHFTLARTEAIAYYFLVLSVYFYVKAYGEKDSLSALWMCGSLLLLFFAALNKAQILVFVPFYFYAGTYFIRQKHNIANKLSKYNRVFQSCALLAFFGAASLYLYRSHGLSLIFNLLLLISLNTVVYVGVKKTGFNAMKSIGLFNTLFFLAFIVAEYLSRLINQGQSLFGNIIDPISMTRFIPNQLESIKLTDSYSLGIPLPSRSQNLAGFLISPIIQIFSKISSATILIFFSFIYIFRYRKTLPKDFIFFGIFCFISYYGVTLINSIRYENAYHYVVFQEFFLLVLALLIINRLANVRTKVKVLLTLILATLVVNLVPYTHYYNWLARKGRHPFCTSGPVHDHLLMDMKKIQSECQLSKTEN